MISFRRAGLHLPLLAIAIAAVGIGYIRSASYDADTGGYKSFAGDQLKWLAIALAGFLAAVAVPYTRIERYAYVLFGAVLLLLAGIPFFGVLANGARSWYQWGSVKLQPSEPMKVALIAATARLLMYRKDMASWRGFLAPFLLAAAPLALVLAQPDLGTILVFLPTILAMLFVAGARLRHFAILAIVAAAAFPISYRFVLKEHQRKRIDIFLNPDLDRSGAGYQAYQSRLAIGSGRLCGYGWGEGPQTQLHTLPDNHTDFIFAVIGEEGGFLVATGLLFLLLVLVLGCLEVAWRTREPFGRLLATGVAALFAGQVVVNAGMTVGLVPITGITLPFVSYGGSSLLTCFVALGLVVNVGMRPVPELGAQA
jgi:rod shape determining protein RodA